MVLVLNSCRWLTCTWCEFSLQQTHQARPYLHLVYNTLVPYHNTLSWVKFLFVSYCLGSCTSLSFEPSTRHCLFSLRPSKKFPQTRHLVGFSYLVQFIFQMNVYHMLIFYVISRLNYDVIMFNLSWIKV